jgi:hypothetical protein
LLTGDEAGSVHSFAYDIDGIIDRHSATVEAEVICAIW